MSMLPIKRIRTSKIFHNELPSGVGGSGKTAATAVVLEIPQKRFGTDGHSSFGFINLITGVLQVFSSPLCIFRVDTTTWVVDVGC